MNPQPADYQMLSFTTRRLVAWIFVLLFFCTAPLLVLYTAGYGYNFKKNVIQKTGSLSIQPTPSSAAIYLDDKLQTASRPDNTLRINNLLPGEYNIRISQDGYYDWQKKLTVNESTNTFVNQVVLFKKAQPLNDLATDIKSWLKTPKNIIYITDNNQLFSIPLSTGQQQNIGQVLPTERLLDFSLDGRGFITLDDQNNYFLYDLEKPGQKVDVRQISNKPLANLSWSPTVDYHLIGWLGQELYQINTITKEIRLLTTLSNNFSIRSNVIVDGTKIFFIATDKKTALTNLYSLETKEQVGAQAILKLKNAPDYTFKKIPTGNITLSSPSQETIWFFNNTLTNLDFVVPAKDYYWLNDTLAQLLLVGDFTVQLSSLDQKISETILRISQTIEHLQPINQTAYFAYQTAGQLKIIEHDGRDQRNLIELNNLGALTDFAISADGRYLYILKNGENNFRLQQTEIQEVR